MPFFVARIKIISFNNCPSISFSIFVCFKEHLSFDNEKRGGGGRKAKRKKGTGGRRRERPT